MHFSNIRLYVERNIQDIERLDCKVYSMFMQQLYNNLIPFTVVGHMVRYECFCGSVIMTYIYIYINLCVLADVYCLATVSGR